MAVAYRGPADQFLREGATDGKIKKPMQDRGGVTDHASLQALSTLNGEQYGYGPMLTSLDVQEPSGMDLVPQNNYPESTGAYG